MNMALLALLLFGYTNAFRALTLVWLVNFFNYGSRIDSIDLLTGSEELIKWVALIIASAIVFARKSVASRSAWTWAPGKNQFYNVLFWVIAALLGSSISSYSLDVSLMKLTTFTIGVFVALTFISMCRNRKEFNAVHSIFASTLAIVVFGSALSFVGTIAYSANGIGFQGILNQPQALAIILAPSVYYLWGVNAKVPGLGNKTLHRAAAILGIILLPLTLARTGLLALSVGFIAGIVYDFGKGKFSKLVTTVACVILILLLLLGGVAQDYILQLVYKHSSDISLSVSDEFTASRGYLVQRGLENFSDNPVFGIGFGLPSDAKDLIVRRDPYFGIPISAPIEKGFAFVALLEETGILGFGAFMFTIFAISRRCLLSGTAMPIQVFATVVASNFGESTLFSLGGLGFLLWLFIGITSDERSLVLRND